MSPTFNPDMFNHLRVPRFFLSLSLYIIKVTVAHVSIQLIIENSES